VSDDATTREFADLADLARSNGRAAPKAGTPIRTMRSKRAAEIPPTRVQWIWPGWLPSSRLALFGGKPGDGKSGVAIDLVARASTGSAFPDGYLPPGPLTCGILSAEDDPSDTLVPRLIAAHADLARVVIANGTVVDSDAQTARPWVLPNDVDVLGELIKENDIDLFVLDPLGAFVASGVDTHRDAAVRAMLLPLSQMARKERCAVLGIRHHRKGGSSDARDAGSGSLAFTAAARIEWVAGRDPQDLSRRVLAVAKTNIGREPESLAYRLVQAECEWDTVAIAWDGTSPLTANQLVGDPMSDDDRSELDDATTFLAQVLEEGPLPAKRVKQLAREADVAEITMQRAKKRLKIRSRKTSSGAWLWVLPEQGDHRAAKQGDHDSGGSILDHLEHVDHLPWSQTDIHRRIPREEGQGDQGDQDSLFGPDDHLPSSPALSDEDIARFEEPEAPEW
jgi:putative DNA primase/helicase